MAVEFPHVDFISVDTIPLVPHAQSPNLLGYEVYDLYNGIAEADESFDLVHVKHVTTKVYPHARSIECVLTMFWTRFGIFLHSFWRFTESFD